MYGVAVVVVKEEELGETTAGGDGEATSLVSVDGAGGCGRIDSGGEAVVGWCFSVGV